jgi:hypothetical protein
MFKYAQVTLRVRLVAVALHAGSYPDFKMKLLTITELPVKKLNI